MNLSFLRRFHWGIVVLCFFFPVVEGCNKEIVYPYREFFHPDRWLQTTIFLYPIVFFLIVALIMKVIKPGVRFAVSWTAAYVLFIGLSFVLAQAVKEIADGYCSLLVCLWGMMAFGLLKSRNENRLTDLIGFFLTAFALWFFPFVFLFHEKILYGGWLYIYANMVVLLAYAGEWSMRCKILAGRYN